MLRSKNRCNMSKVLKIPHERYHEMRAYFSTCWPAVFTARKMAPVPLSTEVGRYIRNSAPIAPFTRSEIRTFLRIWTNRTVYLKVVAESSHRYNLDGTQAEPITDEHREFSIERINAKEAYMCYIHRRSGRRRAVKEQSEFEASN